MCKIHNAKNFIEILVDMGVTKKQISEHTGLPIIRIFEFIKGDSTPTFEEAEKLFKMKTFDRHHVKHY